MATSPTATAFEKLVATIHRLRAPTGCPWDREQTHATLKPYLLEESYEVLEAIDQAQPDVIKDELGDLLLQIVLHAEIASEKNQFCLADIADAISEKMIRRHPHVFADTAVTGVAQVWQNWEKIKKTEKLSEKQKSILDSVPQSLPALFRAGKLQKKAARVGFDWPDLHGVIAKLTEEIKELEEAETKQDKIEEFGDVLFSLVNVARRMDIDAEDALRMATTKFETRFKYIERKVNESGKEFGDHTLNQLEAWWQEAKQI
jgi:MazG family protein